MKMREGGWARQTTAREIPAMTDMAIVNMRLTAGGVRELHWHKAAEWAFMLKGRARITAVDPGGYAFQDDVAEGDLWNFPSGVPHSVQGIDGDGCEFVLVFDEGHFSEDNTFSVTDWFAHTPRDVLAKNFGVPETTFAKIPDKELFIYQAKLPGPLAADKVAGAGPVPRTYSHRMLAGDPIRTKGGRVWLSDSTTFPAAPNIAAAYVEIEPGGMRELHWHPNANEAQYYIAGRARMTVFAGEGRAGTFDYGPGDVGFVPQNMGHYVENTGTTTLKLLELWRADKVMDVSLRQWLAFTPFELVQSHLKIDKSVLAGITTKKTPVVPG
jgi:oxalate decarboxylase